ncbi:hypothetical protein RD792_016765 [Penstemon davidsonii]|uniref:Uncharacterized protein n=1 Tax=Penstemon davidsonii TaxID=160366 RepID=A0ABR0CM07_9LAMI|nr:hypothetical protein RD792_016765 [Penstemon davidsonii]
MINGAIHLHAHAVTGNNNLLPTLAKANYSPYGMNFDKGPTGRFTNGRTVVDFIAEFLGLPYSPPYLSILRALLRSDQLTGLNFASGACGILPDTGNDSGKCLNFAEQINLFERTVKMDLPRHYQNSNDLSNYLSRSIYVITVGSNDINDYFKPQHNDLRSRYTPQSYAQLLINQLSIQLQRLYQLGARKVVMFEIGPLGCIPSITRTLKHIGRCHSDVNNLVVLFNNLLAPMLQNLTSTLEGSSFILGHVHGLGLDAVMNPSNYGPTGRFTNGRTVVDFIAEFLGLPYSPPYLSILRAVLRSDQLTGLNFASGICGILPETGNYLGKCLNFAEQINLFERTVKTDLPRHYQNSNELSNYLSRSIYVISIGSNDYINNYLEPQRYDSSKHYTPQSYAQLLINQLSIQLQRLYQLGARKVVMFEIGPIGCIPSITRTMKHIGRCHSEVNNLAVVFNNLLAPMLQNLTSTLEGSAFILGHAHWLGFDAVMNPSNYGLTDSSNPCCVTWLNGTSACIPELGPLACHDPDKHYFWDGYHLTETVYRTIASLCFNGTSVCLPKNIQDLVLQK